MNEREIENGDTEINIQNNVDNSSGLSTSNVSNVKDNNGASVGVGTTAAGPVTFDYIPGRFDIDVLNVVEDKDQTFLKEPIEPARDDKLSDGITPKYPETKRGDRNFKKDLKKYRKDLKAYNKQQKQLIKFSEKNNNSFEALNSEGGQLKLIDQNGSKKVIIVRNQVVNNLVPVN